MCIKVNKIIEASKDKIIRDIRNLQHEEEDYYKPKKVDKFYSNKFIVCGSRGNKNKTLSIEDYLKKIRAYLKDIINDLKRKYHT